MIIRGLSILSQLGIIILAVLLLTFTGCSRNASVSSDDQEQNLNDGAEVQLSSRTQSLMESWEAEQDAYGDNGDFSPTDQLVSKYHLQKQEDGYHIGAMIRLKEGSNTDKSNLEAMGIDVHTMTGNIATVRVPVESIYELARTSGVKYIEIDEIADPDIH